MPAPLGAFALRPRAAPGRPLAPAARHRGRGPGMGSGQGLGDPAQRQWLADWEADIAELRQEFAAVNAADPDSLRRWFDDHPYLTTHEHGVVAGVSETTIGRRKRRAGRSRK